MSTVLVVDASPLIYSTFNTVGHFCTVKGEPTGLRYGFVRAVRSIKQKTKADKVVICWDLQGKVNKAEGVEEYKANRVMTEEKAGMYAQVPKLKELISLTCWTQASAPGFEADDVIAAVARKLSEQNHTVVINSTDNDMLQLIRPNVTVFVSGKDGIRKDQVWVATEYGVSSDKLLALRSVLGDSSDNMKGLGWKVGTVMTWKEKLNLMPFCETDDALRERADRILTYLAVTGPERETFHRNFNVMRLHNPDSLNIQRGSKNIESLTNLFQELEFKSLMKYIPELTGA